MGGRGCLRGVKILMTDTQSGAPTLAPSVAQPSDINSNLKGLPPSFMDKVKHQFKRETEDERLNRAIRGGSSTTRFASGYQFKSESGKIIADELKKGLGLDDVQIISDQSAQPPKSPEAEGIRRIRAAQGSENAIMLTVQNFVTRKGGSTSDGLNLRLSASMIRSSGNNFVGSESVDAEIKTGDKICLSRLNSHFDATQKGSTSPDRMPDCLAHAVKNSEKMFGISKPGSQDATMTSSPALQLGRVLRLQLESLDPDCQKTNTSDSLPGPSTNSVDAESASKPMQR
jgi:hypothetical protein